MSPLLAFSVLLLLASTAAPTFIPSDGYQIDIHVHAIPDVFRQALIDAKYPVINGTVYVDGFPTPPWTLDTFIQNRDQYGYNYSVVSITAPGVNFLNTNNDRQKLARDLNNQLAAYIKQYPSRLGAFCCIPTPLDRKGYSFNSTIAEIAYCLDVLGFEGVGMYTNYNGVYLGDPFFNPIFAELNRRNATLFVHPDLPKPTPDLLGISAPAIEYPFDTTRAITNLLIQKTMTLYPNFKIILSHGGGTLPYLADRIGGQLTLPFQGNFSKPATIMQMQGFYTDLAASASNPQLAALYSFLGTSHLVLGTDFPYFPAAGIPSVQQIIAQFPSFTADDLKKIKHGNALSLLPKIGEKLSKLVAAPIRISRGMGRIELFRAYSKDGPELALMRSTS